MPSWPQLEVGRIPDRANQDQIVVACLESSDRSSWDRALAVAVEEMRPDYLWRPTRLPPEVSLQLDLEPRCHARGRAALLPSSGREGAGRPAGRGPSVLRVAARAREASADGLDAASAQGPGCLAAGVRAVPPCASSMPAAANFGMEASP